MQQLYRITILLSGLGPITRRSTGLLAPIINPINSALQPTAYLPTSPSLFTVIRECSFMFFTSRLSNYKISSGENDKEDSSCVWSHRKDPRLLTSLGCLLAKQCQVTSGYPAPPTGLFYISPVYRLAAATWALAGYDHTTNNVGLSTPRQPLDKIMPNNNYSHLWLQNLWEN